MYRAITAMKVVFMGPPASGKSFYAALMSQEYAFRPSNCNSFSA